MESSCWFGDGILSVRYVDDSIGDLDGCLQSGAHLRLSLCVVFDPRVFIVVNEREERYLRNVQRFKLTEQREFVVGLIAKRMSRVRVNAPSK